VSEDSEIHVACTGTQHVPERRNDGSLDLYSDGKHSGVSDNEDEDDLAKWAKQHEQRVPVTRSSPNKNAIVDYSQSESDDFEMTYQAGM